MQKIYIRNGTQGSNPLTNLLVIIVGAIVIGVSIVLGFFAFLAVSAVVLLAAMVIGVRTWWATRHLPKNVDADASGGPDFIEGEFHVVKKRKNS